MLHIDDPERLRAFRGWLRAPQAPLCASLSEVERRLLRMLVAPMIDQTSQARDGLDLDAGATLLWAHPHVRAEVLEILAAFGVGGDGARVALWQTGVKWVEGARTDVFAFTLDKTDGRFSPTTRYRDYAVSRELIHWESQSVTRADSDTGRRYQRHASLGTHVMMFARHRASDRGQLAARISAAWRSVRVVRGRGCVTVTRRA